MSSSLSSSWRISSSKPGLERRAERSSLGSAGFHCPFAPLVALTVWGLRGSVWSMYCRLWGPRRIGSMGFLSGQSFAVTLCRSVATPWASKTGSLGAVKTAASGMQGRGIISTFQVLDLTGILCSSSESRLDHNFWSEDINPGLDVPSSQ